jgi:hypothetical protein
LKWARRTAESERFVASKAIHSAAIVACGISDDAQSMRGVQRSAAGAFLVWQELSLAEKN